MKDLFLVVFGFLELMIRVFLLLILLASVVGIFIYVVINDYNENKFLDILEPILWRKL